VQHGDTGETSRATLIEVMRSVDILVGDVKGNMST
jgi:hypothetical protein